MVRTTELSLAFLMTMFFPETAVTDWLKVIPSVVDEDTLPAPFTGDNVLTNGLPRSREVVQLVVLPPYAPVQFQEALAPSAGNAVFETLPAEHWVYDP